MDGQQKYKGLNFVVSVQYSHRECKCAGWFLTAQFYVNLFGRVPLDISSVSGKPQALRILAAVYVVNIAAQGIILLKKTPDLANLKISCKTSQHNVHVRVSVFFFPNLFIFTILLFGTIITKCNLLFGIYATFFRIINSCCSKTKNWIFDQKNNLKMMINIIIKLVVFSDQILWYLLFLII